LLQGTLSTDLRGGLVFSQPQLMLLDKGAWAAWIIDEGGRILECNKEACKLFEWQKGAIVGEKAVEALFSPMSSYAAQDSIKKALEGKDTCQSVVEMTTQAGTGFAALMDVGPWEGSLGARAVLMLAKRTTGSMMQQLNAVVAKMHALALPGQQRSSQSAKEAAAWIEARCELVALLDGLGMAAWCTDFDGRITEANKTACVLLERGHDEMMGMHFASEIVSPVDATTVQQVMDNHNHRSDGKAFLSLVTKGGAGRKGIDAERAPVAVSVLAEICPLQPHGVQMGHIVCAQGTRTDIGALLLDLQGRILCCNSQVQAAIGEAPETLYMRPFVTELVTPETKEEVQSAIAILEQGEEGPAFCSANLFTQKGDEVTLQGEIALHAGPRGEPVGYLVTGSLELPSTEMGLCHDDDTPLSLESEGGTEVVSPTRISFQKKGKLAEMWIRMLLKNFDMYSEAAGTDALNKESLCQKLEEFIPANPAMPGLIESLKTLDSTIARIPYEKAVYEWAGCSWQDAQAAATDAECQQHQQEREQNRKLQRDLQGRDGDECTRYVHGDAEIVHLSEAQEKTLAKKHSEWEELEAKKECLEEERTGALKHAAKQGYAAAAELRKALEG